MKAVIKIYRDDGHEEPDYPWKLRSFGRRHNSYVDPGELGITPYRNSSKGYELDNPELKQRIRNGEAFIVSYFEHGNCVWSLMDEGPQCLFDSVRAAGLLEAVIEDGVSCARGEESARLFLKSYTCWCNGDFIGYNIESEEGEFIDGCGGFFGHDVEYMLQTIADVLNSEKFDEYEGGDADSRSVLENNGFAKILAGVGK